MPPQDEGVSPVRQLREVFQSLFKIPEAFRVFGSNQRIGRHTEPRQVAQRYQHRAALRGEVEGLITQEAVAKRAEEDAIQGTVGQCLGIPSDRSQHTTASRFGSSLRISFQIPDSPMESRELGKSPRQPPNDIARAGFLKLHYSP